MKTVRQFFAGKLPRLIAFDLDGTLVDSARDLTVTIDRMLVELGHSPAGEDKVRSWVGNGAEMLVKRALADSLALDSVVCVSKLEWTPALSLFYTLYQEENGRSACLYEGVDEVLKILSGTQINMVVITNKPRVFAEPLLDALDIESYFQLVLGGEYLPRKKPDPMPLLHACQQFAVMPEDSLMVGDSRNDVVAAQSAGFVSAALTYGYNHGEPVSVSNPDWVMSDFRELIQ